MNRSRFTDIICTMVQLNSKVSPHSVASSSAIDTANHPEIVELLKQSNTESKDEWISVEKELPKESGFYNVICDTDEGAINHSLWFDNCNWYFDSELCKGCALFEPSWYVSVTHWQSLPPKPKQESQS